MGCMKGALSAPLYKRGEKNHQKQGDQARRRAIPWHAAPASPKENAGTVWGALPSPASLQRAAQKSDHALWCSTRSTLGLSKPHPPAACRATRQARCCHPQHLHPRGSQAAPRHETCVSVRSGELETAAIRESALGDEQETRRGLGRCVGG